ncbi:hypothetical protein ACJ73_03015 [Blastomyces percursus]|uniref:Uncharacterized protein n=1 Tax=Blastomyces percursus TaxID=1658174 RepID=A0A1J9RAR8_9EURO|nr:hypothetical protein ACJ73_03015 [Blastomyces percursus]
MARPFYSKQRREVRIRAPFIRGEGCGLSSNTTVGFGVSVTCTEALRGVLGHGHEISKAARYDPKEKRGSELRFRQNRS